MRCFSIYPTSVSDELSSILKKLSLEKYQPIFEEQEVLYLQSEGNYKISSLFFLSFYTL